jgi:hypothetical protein
MILLVRPLETALMAADGDCCYALLLLAGRRGVDMCHYREGVFMVD